LDLAWSVRWNFSVWDQRPTFKAISYGEKSLRL
jgi:hypothetical protein